ncbi:Uncharacterised protein [Mycobacteroides abscessus subsp. massiliense]|nr:hypothetical protein BAB75_10270 [Mycobacteroides immunogenum]RIU10857.1 hypothetical protein D2F01_16285 [Mycobacteroides abscessus]SLD14956.1 Uncharacterised protein [Mycobacteroides abscessus subsp. massiliense]KIU38189.1 hypothetical protein TL11_23590 [Mycobacteroides immunogenum]KPG04576.1 hypothetical protein AN909_22700 [Mycobacteroides immunogenum]
MEIEIGSNGCSLGFFAFDTRKDRLAVTAGHCASGVDQIVYNKFGNRVGSVVAHMNDSSTSRKAIRARGYTVIHIDDSWRIEPYFKATASASKGDSVTKFGLHGKTAGSITDTYYDSDAPWMSTIQGDVVTLGGDSGGPWVTSGPTLLGITASGDYENGANHDDGSQAQPIWSLVTLIRDNAEAWGQGFNVWLDD